jgi:hypothetical protein
MVRASHVIFTTYGFWLPNDLQASRRTSGAGHRHTRSRQSRGGKPHSQSWAFVSGIASFFLRAGPPQLASQPANLLFRLESPPFCLSPCLRSGWPALRVGPRPRLLAGSGLRLSAGRSFNVQRLSRFHVVGDLCAPAS